jgi:hypothetical protein
MACTNRYNRRSFIFWTLVTLNEMRPLLTLPCRCDTAVTQITGALEHANLHVMPSFDSRLAASPTTCPHHGTEQCDCQIVILLVYGTNERPATLMVHGRDGETWISLAYPPDLRPPASLQSHIKNALTLETLL